VASAFAQGSGGTDGEVGGGFALGAARANHRHEVPNISRNRLIVPQKMTRRPKLPDAASPTFNFSKKARFQFSPKTALPTT
jgi:hypothetical protein